LRFACSFEAPLVLEEVPGLFNHRPARWRGHDPAVCNASFL